MINVEGIMEMNDINKTIEAIRAWPDNQSRVYCYELHGDIEAHDPIELKKILKLADAYELQLAINTELNAEVEELRKALSS